MNKEGEMTGGWAAAMAVVMLGMLCHGCGYRLFAEGPGPRIGSGAAVTDEEQPVVRLAIRTVRNRTFHRNLEYAYTRSLRQEFAVGGGARVVADDARADYVLQGEIVSVAVSPLAFSTDETRERRAEVSVSATVTHRRTGDAAWTGTATGAGDFFVNRAPDTERPHDEIQFNQALQDRALEHAGQDAAAALAASFRDAWRRGRFAPGSSSPSAPSRSPVAPPPPVPPSSTFTPLLERLPGSVR